MTSAVYNAFVNDKNKTVLRIKATSNGFVYYLDFQLFASVTYNSDTSLAFMLAGSDISAYFDNVFGSQALNRTLYYVQNSGIRKWNDIKNLKPVATSGSYYDLSDTPTIPTALSQLTADATHRVVTDTEKSTWNGKGTYSKPSGGIPASDLAESYYLASNPNGYTSNTGTITGVQLNGATVASSGVANVQALPNFSLNISHQTAGNPRQVKFLTVDYNTAATYFKMSATSCHDNGNSYQFLEDIIIGCTTSGTVVCNVYKYCQQAVTLDNVARNYGDVFYVIDTTNKKVDFFILCGQYASSQFTPATKIGNTTIAYITQYTGTATYYSSGTKVWASGDSTTYARLSDIPTFT